MRDYDEHRGVVSSISGGDGAAPKRGVDSIPRPSPARAPSSPKRSRISSPRRVLAATAGAVVRAVSRPDDRSDGRASVDHPPSPPRRTRSPADVIAGAFAPPPQPSKRSSNGFAFLGLVPKSAFLNWMRSSIKNNYEGLASSHLKREINNRRSMILYHFSKVGKLSESAESDGRSGPTLRSDVSDDADDWVLDMDAATCAVTNVRRLDRYPIEMLLTLRRGTKLLLLVNVSDDAKLLLSKGAKVDELQRLPKRIIAGREYFQLRCSMEDVSANDALTRADPDDAAAERLFQSDFKGGRKGFIVRFDGTPYQHHFTWKHVVGRPSTNMFFGAPLSQSRAYDSIFRNVGLQTAQQRFLQYYDELEGDVSACLALYNSYLFRLVAITEATCRKRVKEAQVTRKASWQGVFKQKKVVAFLREFDSHCEESLRTVFTQFTNHSLPVISRGAMEGFIARSPEVFGDLWEILCHLRGVKPGQAKEKGRTDDKIHSVFFQILAMARIANRHRLTHWAMMMNIANYARGVGRTAEASMSYFGSTLSDSTRRRLFTKLAGAAAALRKAQGRLFRSCRALLFAYDNYQRGVTLQHQRGEHSSAYFKGTHQVAHKVNEFSDQSFDSSFVTFTQFDQAIPSPWGMPAFETVDLLHPANFFLNYESFQSIVTPEFTGERTRAYIKLSNVASHIRYLSRAFPKATGGEDYFEQCPTEYNRSTLNSFRGRINGEPGRSLVARATAFRQDTVRRWNPSADECTLTVFLGLVGIDESASKECGAITLDLLLRAEVLVLGKDGDWVLADDWEQRRIYLFGDAKTIENITKFVRDMQNRRITYSAANVQSEIFMKAITVVMHLPGDWHTGLNMAQSIYNIFYVGFLDQFQDLLHWQRINSDVSSCYFQATRLVTFVFDELIRFFAHKYMSQRVPTPAEVQMNDTDYISAVALGFEGYIRSLKLSSDL